MCPRYEVPKNEKNATPSNAPPHQAPPATNLRPYVDPPSNSLQSIDPPATTGLATISLPRVAGNTCSATAIAEPTVVKSEKKKGKKKKGATKKVEPTVVKSEKKKDKKKKGATDKVEPAVVKSEKKKGKKKKEKKIQNENQTSIEAVLVDPSPVNKKQSREKYEPSSQNRNVVLVSQSPNDIPRVPFLVPMGTMNLVDLNFPEKASWKLSNKLSKACTLLDEFNDEESSTTLTSSQTGRHRELKIPVVASELVLYAYNKRDSNGEILTKHIENNSLLDLAITRTHRAAILTKGSLQFKKSSFGISNAILYFKEKDLPNIKMSLFDLRGVHVDPVGNNIVTLAYKNLEENKEDKELLRYVVYQTPEIGRFLLPMAKTVVAAYIGVPQWAIPITWSGNLPSLPPIQQHEYDEWMSTDGGFASSVYAAVLAYHVQQKIHLTIWRRESISKAIRSQQPTSSGAVQLELPLVLNLRELIKCLTQSNSFDTKEQEFDLNGAYIKAGLNALAFNLMFRKLILTKCKFTRQRNAIQNVLGRALLYNVTLREVDFESSDLRGFGETIGNAWSMNAQPLISRINFSNCSLLDKDLLGIMRGLARIWCGGTALAQSISFANNSNIQSETWDTFFRVFLDPSTLSIWPKQSPPPPNLSFLQELDFRGANAIGSGFVQMAKRLTGLRSLQLSANGGNRKISEVLSALHSANAPLEVLIFEGIDLSEDPGIIEAFFRHSQTVKEINLIGLVGDGCQLLCGWPEPVPKLSLEVGKYSRSSSWASHSGTGFSPGTITMHNYSGFCIKAMGSLAISANGLKELVIYGAYYWQLVGFSHMLVECGLEVLHIYPPDNQTGSTKINNAVHNILTEMNTIGVSHIERFWDTLAVSKTLRDLQCPNQVLGGVHSHEVAMIGRFLKSNRSVQNIGFDHSYLILNVEDVKILRSAFYGNKKVVRMEFLNKAKQATLKAFRNETNNLIRQVEEYRYEIKRLFKRAYSKYNWRWRDKPNQEKLPWVEKIRVAKRKISKLNRDQAKIATLLDEIMRCIIANQRTQKVIEEQKANERLIRRQGQLEQLASKKKKLVTSLVIKLRKAKIRGRRQKSAKMQVPRSTYYKSRNMWPSRRRRYGHSYYDYYNDPYYARCYGYWGDDDSSCDTETSCDWLESSLCQLSSERDDPWSDLDSLIQSFDTNYHCVTDSEFLTNLHNECSELGIDVLEDTSNVLDQCAAVDDKLDDIGTSMNISNDTLRAVVDSSLADQFDLAAVDRNLPDVPEYDAFVDALDADNAVTMYAGAGPHDLDDGGPSFGGSSNAALAGARRRATSRKKRRVMAQIREKMNRRLTNGYQHLSIAKPPPNRALYEEDRVWPTDFVHKWIEEAKIQQVKSMAESNLFDLPDVSNKPHYLLTEWSYNSVDQQHSIKDIEVVLVTQCSLDRLSNLESQLSCWTGKASVALYLKPTQNKLDVLRTIISTIANAKSIAGNHGFDVALTLVEGNMEEEPYPINYLRNVALLEAKRQHLRFNSSLENSATLLVDVDFRPSSNLHSLVHSKHAANSILRDGKVVVCPAFEHSGNECPRSVLSLKESLDKGQAEGFHQSHFPQGHGPTKFETFWEKSLPNNIAIENDEMGFWMKSYAIQYEDLFEPYIVMASSDVPLYDERFQGYGLNKVSHLATVSRQKAGDFIVLPGVFLVAPAHERSEAWSKIYGSTRSDDNKFNQLFLKGLYYNFMKNLDAGKDPVVSETTRSNQQLLLQQERKPEQVLEESKRLIRTCRVGDAENPVVCY